jgi:hypothetical protein
MTDGTSDASGGPGGPPTSARPPMNSYTAMLLLSFVALAVGCLLLALDLFGRRLPLSP